MALIKCPSCGFTSDLNSASDADFVRVGSDGVQHAVVDNTFQVAPDNVAVGVPTSPVNTEA